jgi:RimJ/RimL family protein N-acetyltransferase
MGLHHEDISRLEFNIQPLPEDKLPQYKALRLRALQLHPDAFLEEPDAFERKTIEMITASMRAASDKGGFTLIASNAKGEVVGTASLGVGDSEKLAHRGYVWGVFVTPEARGHGIARQLMESIMTRARELPSITTLQLGVVCSNAKAVKLYESLGFTVYGKDEEALHVKGEYLDEYLMSKRLR